MLQGTGDDQKSSSHQAFLACGDHFLTNAQINLQGFPRKSKKSGRFQAATPSNAIMRALKNDSPCPKVPGKTKKIQILKESLVTLKNPEAIRLDNQPNHGMKGAKVLFF